MHNLHGLSNWLLSKKNSLPHLDGPPEIPERKVHSLADAPGSSRRPSRQCGYPGRMSRAVRTSLVRFGDRLDARQMPNVDGFLDGGDVDRFARGGMLTNKPR